MKTILKVFILLITLLISHGVYSQNEVQGPVPPPVKVQPVVVPDPPPLEPPTNPEIKKVAPNTEKQQSGNSEARPARRARPQVERPASGRRPAGIGRPQGAGRPGRGR